MVELISLRDDFFSHSWKLSRVPFLQQKARKLNPNNSPPKIYYHKRRGCDSCISSTCRSQLLKNTFQIYNSQKLFLGATRDFRKLSLCPTISIYSLSSLGPILESPNRGFLLLALRIRMKTQTTEKNSSQERLSFLHI